MGIYGEFDIEAAVSKMNYYHWYRIDPNKPLYELMMLEFKKRIDTHRDLEFSNDYTHIWRIETIDQFSDEEFRDRLRLQRSDHFLAELNAVTAELIEDRKKPEYKWPMTVKQLKELNRNKKK